jgi:tetratricopeptide (TPR) repeat protein
MVPQNAVLSTEGVGGVHLSPASSRPGNILFKRLFGGGGKREPEQEYSIDDLVVLERFEEAGDRLRSRLKSNPQDLHAHLKLAEVYQQLKQFGKAIDEYAFVAEEYAQDGFYDKGLALLSKAMRLGPDDSMLRAKLDKMHREKSLEQVRGLAIEGLRQAAGAEAGGSTLELQRLWHNLAQTVLVQKLPGEMVKRLFSVTQIVHWPAGETPVLLGSAESFLVILVRGLIEAVGRDASGREVLLRSFGPGDILGDGVLFERLAWPATFRVPEAATLLKLTREGLEKALVGNPDPRGFLELLRSQHNDRDVAASLKRLRGDR